MLEQYIPKRFGKEYYDINGSCQYPMFVATALGIKNSFDDWIEVNRYEEFLKVCKDYGLRVETDVVFIDQSRARDDVVGGKNLTTTNAIGVRMRDNPKEGRVHVFVSTSKKEVEAAKRFGWYPVETNNYCINKPFVDHLRFGKILGFPDCCVDFFRKYNNWKLYNHPYEIFKNTEGQPLYQCNNHLMDNTYFFIHHLPCSYRCKRTIEYANKVEEGIREVEPDFVKKAVGLLKSPFLIFGERHYVMFYGKLKGSTVRYDNTYYNTNPAIPEDRIDFIEKIRKGNRIRFEKGSLVIMKNEKIIESIDAKKEWFMTRFE